jgi:hypothetical protein
VKEYSIRQYNSNDKLLWNSFLKESKNATFLFERDFMEYHNDRFEDFSLMVFANEKLVAILPANRIGQEVFSHQGLTYGGFVFIEKITTEIVEYIFEETLSFLKSNEITMFIIKQMPSIYSKLSSNQIDYFLFKFNAKLEKREMNLAIDFSNELLISKSKLKHFRRVSTFNFEIKEELTCDSFWNNILIPRLKEKYNSKPVHSLTEINKLKSKFPDNIKQYNIYYEAEIVAGITLFQSNNIVKSQYGATSQKGEVLRALDFLYITLINEFHGKVNFFDMGTVNENNGKTYNKGLLKQKEELGCSVYLQDCYTLII